MFPLGIMRVRINFRGYRVLIAARTRWGYAIEAYNSSVNLHYQAIKGQVK